MDESWELCGRVTPGKEPAEPEFTGVVKDISPTTGCAFVESPEVAASHGRDAYVHRSVIQQCGLNAGDEIMFNLHVSAAGNPQVSSPVWRRAGQGGDEMAVEDPGELAAPPAQAARKRPLAAIAGAGPAESVSRPRTGNSGTAEYVTWSEEREAPEGLLLGSVKSVDHEKGFTLIYCPDSGYEVDVYLHTRVASSAHLAQGDVVAFALHISPAGKPQATEPVWKRVGRASGGGVTFGAHIGVIKRVLDNGNGFVDCEELQAEYSKEPFCHATVMGQCMLAEGQTIIFDAHISAAGNPQVSAPCWKCISGEEGAIALQSQPVQPAVASGKNGKGKDFGAGGKDFGKGKVPKGQAAMTWGFDDAWAKGFDGWGKGKDAWGKGKDFGGWGKGFDAGWGPVKGWGKGEADKGWGKGASDPWGKGKAGKPAFDGGGKGKASKGSAPVDIETLPVGDLPEGFNVGAVVHVDPTRHFSRVAVAGGDASQQVYVHGSVAEPTALEVNDLVCFQIHHNKKGQPQASAPFWKQVGRKSAGAQVDFGEHQGMVINQKDSGCAFVDNEELENAHGKKAYIHSSVMQQCGLFEGNLIAFKVHVSGSGNPQVSAPCWICCSAPELIARADAQTGGKKDSAQDDPFAEFALDEAAAEAEEEPEAAEEEPAEAAPKTPPRKPPAGKLLRPKGSA